MSRTDHRWSALALIVTAQFMVILDVAIVNVALPSIKTDLNFSQENLQWVISAYAILFGGVLLLGGRLADLLGRRRLFIAGLVLFSVASLLCGLAWSEASLIGFRALQGLGGALLAPAALSLLTTMFAEGRERNLALGIYGAASGSGAAVGVLLGGLLDLVPGLVVGLLHQRPGRDRGDRADACAAARRPREPRAPALRRPRRGHHHGRTDAARLRDHPRGEPRLGLARHARALRRRGRARRGLRPDRAALAPPAAAAADLPLAHADRRERGDGDRRRGRVLRVLPADALPAGRPALLGGRERPRLHGLRLERRRDLEHRAAGRLALRRPADADRRPARQRALGRLADAPAGGRQLLLGSLPGLRARRRGDGPLVRPGDDREPDRGRAGRCRGRLRPDQHEPPDRRRRRHRRGQRDRGHFVEQLRRHARARADQRRARPRLPDRALRAHRAACCSALRLRSRSSARRRRRLARSRRRRSC